MWQTLPVDTKQTCAGGVFEQTLPAEEYGHRQTDSQTSSKRYRNQGMKLLVGVKKQNTCKQGRLTHSLSPKHSQNNTFPFFFFFGERKGTAKQKSQDKINEERGACLSEQYSYFFEVLKHELKEYGVQYRIPLGIRFLVQLFGTLPRFSNCHCRILAGKLINCF